MDLRWVNSNKFVTSAFSEASAKQALLTYFADLLYSDSMCPTGHLTNLINWFDLPTCFTYPSAQHCSRPYAGLEHFALVLPSVSHDKSEKSIY